jgi:putative endonuclease
LFAQDDSAAALPKPTLGKFYQLSVSHQLVVLERAVCWKYYASDIYWTIFGGARHCEVRHFLASYATLLWGCEFPAKVAQLYPQFTKTVLNLLDRVAGCVSRSVDLPPHQLTGRRGEEDAYFHLRKLGYIIVARNYRSHRRRGEIDLIGWDQDVLCFIEVKTRTSHDVKPAEAAVDPAKRRELSSVARDYLRRLPPSCQWRFDIVSVYYEERQTSRPKFELFKNAFHAS